MRIRCWVKPTTIGQVTDKLILQALKKEMPRAKKLEQEGNTEYIKKLLRIERWIAISEKLRSEEYWYEADGRHATKVRNYYRKLQESGATVPQELTKKEWALYCEGQKAFEEIKYDLEF